MEMNSPPDLQELVAAAGGYDKITPGMWAAFDRAMADWQLRRRERYGGAIERPIDRRAKRASARFSR
jgi:hypothetical protein